MAPAAGPFLIGFGQQVIDGIDALGVDSAQRLQGKIVAGVEEGEAFRALVFGFGRPVEVYVEVAVQRRAAASVGGVEQEVLHVHRHKFFGVADLV